MRRPTLLTIVPILLAARVGHAETTAAKERTARTACLSGDYAKGVQLLSELFVGTMDPTFIYDQGRCFEQNRRYEDAIARFQEYLRAGRKLSRADKADAQKHIDDCKELLASQPTQAPVIPPPSAVPPAPPVATPPIATAAAGATPAPVIQADLPLSSDTGSGLRTAGIATVSVGAAALVASAILNLKVNSIASDLTKTDGYSPSKESDRKTYQTLGWVGYGIGAACLATGAVLYILGVRSGDGGRIALVPTLGSDHAGAALQGAF